MNRIYSLLYYTSENKTKQKRQNPKQNVPEGNDKGVRAICVFCSFNDNIAE